MQTYQVFLPFVGASGPLFTGRLGVQQEGRLSSALPWFHPDWIYHWSIRWHDYPNEIYSDNIETLLGRSQIITLKVCPEEHRLWPRFVGSPPKPDSYSEFVRFAQGIIDWARPDAIALFNEPNVWVPFATSPENFGAWVGRDETMYQGGYRYGQFTKEVVPQLRDAKVIVGELMINDLTLEFLRGAIDGGLTGDFLSYHVYLSLHDEFSKLDEWASKLSSLTNLPLAVTETSIIDSIDSPELRQKQLEYAQFLRAKTLESDQVKFVEWYTLANNGWGNSDLVTKGVAQPAYYEWSR